MGGQVAPFIPVLTAHLGQQLARNQLFQGPLGWIAKLINENLTGYTPTKYDLARSQVGQGGDSSNDIVPSGIAARIADSLSPGTGSAVSQIFSRSIGDRTPMGFPVTSAPRIDLTEEQLKDKYPSLDLPRARTATASEPQYRVSDQFELTDGSMVTLPGNVPVSVDVLETNGPLYKDPFPPVEAPGKEPAMPQIGGPLNIPDGSLQTSLPSGEDPFPGIMDPVTTQRVGDIFGGLGGLAVGIPLARRVAKMGKDPKAERDRVPNYIQRGRGWNLKATAPRPREVDISLKGVPGAKRKKDLIDLIRKRMA